MIKCEQASGMHLFQSSFLLLGLSGFYHIYVQLLVGLGAVLTKNIFDVKMQFSLFVLDLFICSSLLLAVFTAEN